VIADIFTVLGSIILVIGCGFIIHDLVCIVKWLYISSLRLTTHITSTSKKEKHLLRLLIVNKALWRCG